MLLLAELYIAARYYISTSHLLCCIILDYPKEFARFLKAKKSVK